MYCTVRTTYCTVQWQTENCTALWYVHWTYHVFFQGQVGNCTALSENMLFLHEKMVCRLEVNGLINRYKLFYILFLMVKELCPFKLKTIKSSYISLTKRATFSGNNSSCFFKSYFADFSVYICEFSKIKNLFSGKKFHFNYT